MSQKKQFDWDNYMDALAEQQSTDQALAEMEDMTPRDIYNMPSYTNAACYLVDRPVNFAMHGAIINYPLNPVEVMQDCLIDGETFYKIEDWQHIRKEPFVWKADVDQFTDEILFVVICYPVNEGKNYYWETYLLGPTGSVAYTQYNLTQNNTEKDYERLTPFVSIEIPFMPFVRIAWKHGESFLLKPKPAIMRLEMVSRIIAVENTERKGMALYITGIDNVDKIKRAPRKFGRGTHILPTGAGFAFPPSDEAGIRLLGQEPIDLWRNIEKSTGVVSVDTLAALSGISRQIAEKPLLMLGEDIRTTFNNFLLSIYDLVKFQNPPEPTTSYKPMETLPTFEDNKSFIDILDTALEKEAISVDEWKQKVRYILGLDSNQ